MRGVWASIKFEQSEMMVSGMLALMRNGKCVYYGSIGDPIKDAEFDKIVFHPSDVNKLGHWIEEERAGRPRTPP